MNIVVLDGYTLNPGDLLWDGFTALGKLTVYNRTPPELIITQAKDAKIILTNKTPLGEDELAGLPLLEYIGVLATGYNIVDIEAARRHNIVVTNTPDYGTRSVAQMVFAHLLTLCHRVQKHNDAVKGNAWSGCPDFSFWEHPQVELAGKTMGIIGFGRIGRQVAEIASVFGMKIIAYSRTIKKNESMSNLRLVELEELFMESDVVSLHCPLVPDTEGLINKTTLSLMKKSAILINTSRGGLVVEEDLAKALDEGQIAWAAVDVLSKEPPSPLNPLIKSPKCLVTPHIAWATKEARTRLMNIALNNVKGYLAQKPVNVVT